MGCVWRTPIVETGGQAADFPDFEGPGQGGEDEPRFAIDDEGADLVGLVAERGDVGGRLNGYAAVSSWVRWRASTAWPRRKGTMTAATRAVHGRMRA